MQIQTTRVPGKCYRSSVGPVLPPFVSKIGVFLKQSRENTVQDQPNCGNCFSHAFTNQPCPTRHVRARGNLAAEYQPPKNKCITRIVHVLSLFTKCIMMTLMYHKQTARVLISALSYQNVPLLEMPYSPFILLRSVAHLRSLISRRPHPSAAWTPRTVLRHTSSPQCLDVDKHNPPKALSKLMPRRNRWRKKHSRQQSRLATTGSDNFETPKP